MKLLSRTNNFYLIITAGIALVFSVFTHIDLVPHLIQLKAFAAIIFLLIVIYAALRDGILPALVSAVIAEAYFLYSYKIFENPTSETIGRLLIIGFTLTALSYILGNFKKTMTNNLFTEKLAREKAEKIADMLEKNSLQKEQFISIASHELKTPITSLKILTQLLERKAAEEKNEQTAMYAKRIDNQLNNLIHLATNLLDVSRLNAGKLKMNMEFFDIDPIINTKIEEIANINETHTLIKKRNATQIIMGDKNYLGQVIINLLTNAVRYSPEGSNIIVSVKEDKQKMTISVQDFGNGIPKEHQKKIFEQFYQIEGTSGRGLGIGLYISAQIIKQHGGKIIVKSQPGKGSTFSILLPLSS